MGWRTRHGEAVIVWSLGKPETVVGTHLPDGSRGETRDTLDHGFRRPSTGSKLWIYGTLDIRPDDVFFIDGQQPVYEPPPRSDVPSLEADLARDPRFRSALQDDRFALATYTVFRNRTFIHIPDGRTWGCGERQAAFLVAQLRDRGESYHDYFLRDGLKGEYPDDRPDAELKLQAEIDRISKQLDTPVSALPIEALVLSAFPPAPKLGEPNARQISTIYTGGIDALRRWLEQHPAQIEALRAQQRRLLDSAKHQLARHQADDINSDVLEALRAHLSRLGWRTENEQDRAQARAARIQKSVLVLQELRELEKRPEGAVADWAEVLRKQQRPDAIMLHGPPDKLKDLSPDEREVQTGGLQRRLLGLALSGRVTKEEYDALTARASER